MNISHNKNAETFKVVGDWNTQAKRLKEKFTKLSDADLKFEAGKEDDLFKRLGTRLNKNRLEVITLIKKNQEETSKVL
jgi:hypothetical protein